MQPPQGVICMCWYDAAKAVPKGGAGTAEVRITVVWRLR